MIDIQKTDNKIATVNNSVITNSRAVLNHIVNLQTKAFEDGKNMITQSCMNELTKKFGKHNTTFRGEHNFKIWILEYNGYLFDIVTAKGYGTKICVSMSLENVHSGNYDKIIIEFINQLSNIINE